jgi:hypothetical protein
VRAAGFVTVFLTATANSDGSNYRGFRMTYVIAIPVVLVLVLLAWVVVNMVRSREDRDRPSTAVKTPDPPVMEDRAESEVRR